MEDRLETRYVLFHFLISVFVFMVFFAKRIVSLFKVIFVEFYYQIN